MVVEHHCHATGCRTNVEPEKLMCWAHWKTVPKVIQERVYATYRPGQCDDKSPSTAWHHAADAAICAVALLEGKPVTAAQVRAITKFKAAELGERITLGMLSLIKHRSRQLQS